MVLLEKAGHLPNMMLLKLSNKFWWRSTTCIKNRSCIEISKWKTSWSILRMMETARVRSSAKWRTLACPQFLSQVIDRGRGLVPDFIWRRRSSMAKLMIARSTCGLSVSSLTACSTAVNFLSKTLAKTSLNIWWYEKWRLTTHSSPSTKTQRQFTTSFLAVSIETLPSVPQLKNSSRTNGSMIQVTRTIEGKRCLKLSWEQSEPTFGIYKRARSFKAVSCH